MLFFVVVALNMLTLKNLVMRCLASGSILVVMDPGRVEVGFDPLTDPTGLTLQNRSVLEIGSRVRSQSAFGTDF